MRSARISTSGICSPATIIRIIADQVIGKHVAHIGRRPIGAQHANFNVETNVLGLVPLVGIGADTDRQDEIPHEHPVDIDIVLAGR